MERLRGIVVGCGHMGRHHARKLLARPDVELVGVLDPDPLFVEGARQLAEAPDRLDFAVVATPTQLHPETALPLLRAGVPCLIEKPIAATPEAAAELAEFRCVSVDQIERFNPALSCLPEGFSPRYLRAERLSPFAGRGADVDVVHDLMIHDLDLVLHLTGSAVCSVRAVGVSVLTDGVDIAEAWLETEGGQVATLTASRVSRAPSRRLRLVADGTYWSLDLGARKAQRVRWGEERLDAEPLEVPAADALEGVHDAFLAAVRGEGPWPVPGREGLAALELAVRVSQAIADRGPAA